MDLRASHHHDRDDQPQREEARRPAGMTPEREERSEGEGERPVRLELGGPGDGFDLQWVNGEECCSASGREDVSPAEEPVKDQQQQQG